MSDCHVGSDMAWADSQWPKQKDMGSATFCFGHWLSAQSTSDPTWQSDMAKLRLIEKVVDKIQPGSIECFTWAEPINSAFLLYIFLFIFSSYMGLAQPFGFFIF